MELLNSLHQRILLTIILSRSLGLRKHQVFYVLKSLMPCEALKLRFFEVWLIKILFYHQLPIFIRWFLWSSNWWRMALDWSTSWIAAYLPFRFERHLLLLKVQSHHLLMTICMFLIMQLWALAFHWWLELVLLLF